jgi:hypothetical protein
MIPRTCKLSKSNSFFLFGPRGTGKTTLIRDQFPDEQAVYVNLLDDSLMDQFLLDFDRFKDFIDQPQNRDRAVIVDEVQRLPKILNIAHMQIQQRKRQFILTGSSSRKLKQLSANLLAGRAWLYHLYPLSTGEMGQSFDLKKVLEFGGLPDAFLSSPNDAKEYLASYVATYLQKEIQQEQWVKNLEPFRRFLAVAAQMNGKIVNKAKIAKQVGVDPSTVNNYFEILEDTSSKSWKKSVKKDPLSLLVWPFLNITIMPLSHADLFTYTCTFASLARRSQEHDGRKVQRAIVILTLSSKTPPIPTFCGNQSWILEIPWNLDLTIAIITPATISIQPLNQPPLFSWPSKPEKVLSRLENYPIKGPKDSTTAMSPIMS